MSKLIKNSKLSNKQIRLIIYYFTNELTAVQTSKMTKVHRNTVDRIYKIFREKIANYQENNQTFFKGVVELDESYFGGKRKYLRGRAVKPRINLIGIMVYLQKGSIST